MGYQCDMEQKTVSKNFVEKHSHLRWLELLDVVSVSHKSTRNRLFTGFPAEQPVLLLPIKDSNAALQSNLSANNI